MKAILALLAACTAIGEETNQPPGELATPERPLAITACCENDSALPKPNANTDRHYTNGVELTIAFQPQWADDLAAWVPLAPAGSPVCTAAGASFGQLIFTPDKIDRPDLRTLTDRPYAGWLYGSVFWQRQVGDVFDHLELNVGIAGPLSRAEQVQKTIHDTFDEADPIGWDRQLGNEIGLELTALRRWRWDLTDADAPFGAQLIPQAAFTVGNLRRHAECGAVLRAGLYLPDDFGPSSIDQPASATGLETQRYDLSGYGFVRLGGRAVGHDYFLSGVDHEPLVGEVEVGLVLAWRNWRLGYSQTYMTHDFKSQQGTDAFATLALTYACRF